MRYASITRNDRNPIKRMLQRRRLGDALSLAKVSSADCHVVDYGAGDGETCRRLASAHPHAHVWCYEPCDSLREEAIENLHRLPNTKVVARCEDLPVGQCDVVICMEVFEHLPPQQTRIELKRIYDLLKPGGAALIGVPLEVYLPALVKGAFRMARRFGQFDARPLNILRAGLGRPPGERPLHEIAPGLPYYFHHLGFDHRRLRGELCQWFTIERTVCSPLPWLSSVLNSEMYFLARKRA